MMAAGDTTGAGSQIGDYEVQRLIGAGGMGEVYLVQHPRLPRQDALKLLDVTVSRNAQFSHRFQREADLLAPLRHPNIITIHDRGVHEGRLWLTMEYVDGMDAAQLLRRQGALPLELVVQIIGGAGAALDYAYGEYQITHRDVKPANILIEFDRSNRLKTVKLADFGIAKAAGESTSLTSTGVTIGTMSYISPEAISGQTLDNRADIYSLGCAAFELLTGTLPYTAPTLPALMRAHTDQPIPSITERNPALPAYLDTVFAKVLAKEPGDRYQTAEAFVEALRDVPSVPYPDTVDRWDQQPAERLPGDATVDASEPPVSHGLVGQPHPTVIDPDPAYAPTQERVPGVMPPKGKKKKKKAAEAARKRAEAEAAQSNNSGCMFGILILVGVVSFLVTVTSGFAAINERDASFVWIPITSAVVCVVSWALVNASTRPK